MKTVFWTFAYNAEKTIERAIKSILNQSCGDFLYYILDNGCTDKTGQIILDYAAKDSRIIPLREEVNIGNTMAKYRYRLFETGDEGFFAQLDADDEYCANFLEKTLDFALSHNLDAVACGTEWISPPEIRKDIPAQTLVIQGQDFVKCLPKYYRYTNRLWGILFARKLLRKMKLGIPFKISESGGSFSDAVYAFLRFTRAERAGLLAECLHKYYILPDSLSYKYNPYWFQNINESQLQLRSFITSRGILDDELTNFLHIQFLTKLKYVLPRIMCADVPVEQKLKDIEEILSSKQIDELLALDWKTVGIYSDKEVFLKEIRQWIDDNKVMQSKRSHDGNEV